MRDWASGARVQGFGLRVADVAVSRRYGSHSLSFIVAVMGSWRLLVFVALNVSIVFVNVLNDVATVTMIAASCFELPACCSILISFSS